MWKALQKVLGGVLGDPLTPARLLARYKEILAAILPVEFLTPEGLLRLSSGEGEEVRIEVATQAPPGTRFGHRAGAFVDNVMDRALVKCLRPFEEDLGGGIVAEIRQFATEYFRGSQPSRIVLFEVEDGLFVHEVFHDIQGYFYDHHPGVQDVLRTAALDEKAWVENLYAHHPGTAVMPGIVSYPPQCRWLATYRPSQLFPMVPKESPYCGVYDPLLERFGWSTLFRIRAALDAATIELANNEVIPTLLQGFMYGDDRVTPLLQKIFQRAGLNDDFDSRLRASQHTISPTQRPRRKTANRNTRPVPNRHETPQVVLPVVSDDIKKFPSFPPVSPAPTLRVVDPWRCPRCGMFGIHVLVTNAFSVASGIDGTWDVIWRELQKAWRDRPVAIDTLMCRIKEHMDTAVYPLLLDDITVSALDRDREDARLKGNFDLAEIAALRAINARPDLPLPRIHYANLLLDRLKLSRLLPETPNPDPANDHSLCLRQAGEMLRAVSKLEGTPHARTLTAHGRLLLESGDREAAAKMLKEAKAQDTAADAELELGVFAKDIEMFSIPVR